MGQNESEKSDRPRLNWYPGHMAKALREIKEKLKLVDIVFEVRDARLPLVSGNPGLDDILREKCRLIILNKVNLADPVLLKGWETWIKKQEMSYFFVNCLEKGALKKSLAMAREIIEKRNLKSNPNSDSKGFKKKKLKIMVIGLPNTGKSTIINQLAGRNAAKTADHPGQTQMQQWIAVDQDKNNDLELLDTPGVMPPHIGTEEHGLWLSAIHAMPDDVVGEQLTATFIVEYLLKNKSSIFQERFQLPNLNLTPLLAMEKIAVLRGCLKQKGELDLERVYKLVLQEFRKGNLGHSCFESPPSV